MANNNQPNRKNNKSFQYGTFFLEKVLGINTALFTKEKLNELLEPKALGEALTPRFVEDIVKNIKSFQQDYGSEQSVKRKQQSYLEKASKKKRRLSNKFKDSPVSSKDSPISSTPSASLNRARSFLNARPVNTNSLRPAFTSAPSFTDLNASADTPTAGTLARSERVLENLLEAQEDTYKVSRDGFKESNKTLKDMLKALGNLSVSNGGGGGVFDWFSDGKGKGKGTMDKIAKASPLAFLAKYAKTAAKVAGPVAAGLDLRTNVQSINKAEELGLFSPEQAALLRKKALIKAGTAGVGSFAGGAAGATVAGPVGAIAGGYAGYKLGEIGGAAFGEKLLGAKLDRTAGYLATVANMESSLQANPPSTGTSSAAGLFQFMPATWESLNKKYRKGWDITAEHDPRLDSKKAIEMMKLLTAENQAGLQKKLDRPVTDTDLYAAHFLGVEGASKLLKANDQATASLLLPAAAAANPAIFSQDNEALTVKQVRDLLSSRYVKKAAELGLAAHVTVPSTPQAVETSAVMNTSTITDDVVQGVAKAEVSKMQKETATQEKVASSLVKMTQPTKTNIVTTQQAADAASQGRNQSFAIMGGSNGNQTAMSDINSIHFTDGMLLNVLLD